MSFKIIGTGSALPASIKTNDDFSDFLETDDEWIKQRTGISSRHICTTETISDLASNAALRAIENAGICAEELDLILCSTIRGDFFTPSLACVVQKNIGANCAAFDINAACSGFVYAMDIAAGYFARKRVKKVLIVSAETMSKLTDFNDRSTCVLFGDGAGSVVLAEGSDFLSVKITAKGNTDVLAIPNVGGNCPFSLKEFEQSFLQMKGKEVFKFAVTSMCRDLKDVIADAGFTSDQIDWVFPHQANIRIIKTAQAKLDIPVEKYAIGISDIGNISSACIPTLLDKFNREGRFHKGDIIAMSTFGGGFTTGAGVVRWSL